MACDSEEIRQRQLRRRQERQRREQQRLRRRRRTILGALAAAIVLAVCGIVILAVRHSTQPKTPQATISTTPPVTEPVEPETVIHLAFGGDVSVTDQVVASGLSADGYNYQEVFRDVVPALAGADVAVLNFEGNLCGAPYGTQTTSAPAELAQALAAAGVDLLQVANSCAINNGLLGLTDTLESIRNAGMEPVGANASDEELAKNKGFTLVNVQGVKVAFVAFTKGVGSLGLPEGSEGRVNLLYTDYTSTYQDVNTKGITEILDAVALEKPDVTVALLHWGSEYNGQVSDSQKEIVSLMQKNGVDAIIGTHSHYLQDITYDQKTGALVAYSLGDFLGDGDKSGSEYSVILNLEIVKDNRTGTAKITGYDCTPIYTLRPEMEGAPLRLLRIREAMAVYEANGSDKVSETVYASMKTALAKIESRTGK